MPRACRSADRAHRGLHEDDVHARKPANALVLSHQGDVQGKRPGMLDLTGRAKYDAWAGRKGLGREAAMQQYVAVVERLLRG